jgi:2',3'-cyclic-nucleotide 2'-phosphodiesterase (5'-nucleotidase family)
MRRVKPILTALLVMLVALAIFAPTAYQTAAPEGSTTITIIHTNDLHGRFEGSGTIIGVDRIAAVYAATDNAILVDAGDTIHGLPFVNNSNGMNAIRLMNAAGYRVMVPGNHDFNYAILNDPVTRLPITGKNHLLTLENYADFDILAANLTWKATGDAVFSPYTVIEIDGVQVGFFGLVFPDTPTVTHPDGVVDFAFGCPIEPARRSVAALQAAGADVIVAVAHLGVDVDALAIAVAEHVPGIHVIIDGHSHTSQPAGLLVNGTLLAQTGGNGTEIGVVEIVVYNGTVHSVSASLINHEMAQEFEPVAEIEAMIAEMVEENAAWSDTVVGYNPTLLVGDRDVLRFQEAPLGNIVANALRTNVGAQLAIANSGGIRVDLPAGDITNNNISAVLPFPNYSVKVAVTPAILWEALEVGVSAPGHGRFPQVSGFSFVYDAEAEEGERILSIIVDGAALNKNDNTTTFTLAINDFMASGGDGYTMFVGLPVLAQGDIMADLLITYMDEHDFSSVGLESRIINTPGVVAAARAPEETVIAIEPITIEEISFRPWFSLPIPVAGEPLLYTAQAGETLWSITYNFYGTMHTSVINRVFAANYALLSANNNTVTAGMVLTLPANGLRDPIARTHTGDLHLVRAGQTLSDLALHYYGDRALWTRILEANRSRVHNANMIIEGQWIVVPY